MVRTNPPRADTCTTTKRWETDETYNTEGNTACARTRRRDERKPQTYVHLRGITARRTSHPKRRHRTRDMNNQTTESKRERERDHALNNDNFAKGRVMVDLSALDFPGRGSLPKYRTNERVFFFRKDLVQTSFRKLIERVRL